MSPNAHARPGMYTAPDTASVAPDDPRYAEILRQVFLSGYVPEADPVRALKASSVIVGAVQGHMRHDLEGYDRTSALFTVLYLRNFATGTDLTMPTSTINGHYISDEQDGTDPVTGLILVRDGLSLRLDDASLCADLPEYLVTYLHALKAKVEKIFREKKNALDMEIRLSGLASPSLYHDYGTQDVVQRLLERLPIFMTFPTVGDMTPVKNRRDRRRKS